MRTAEDFRQSLSQHNIDASLIDPDGDTPTVPAAAEALGCTPDQVIKSLLFLVKRDGGEREPALVIAAGTNRVDYRALADTVGVGRKEVRMASFDEVVEITGYPAGGVPPFGHLEVIPTYVDRSVLDNEVVFGGGGDDGTMLRINVEDLLRVTDATIVHVVEASGNTGTDGT